MIVFVLYGSSCIYIRREKRAPNAQFVHVFASLGEHALSPGAQHADVSSRRAYWKQRPAAAAARGTAALRIRQRTRASTLLCGGLQFEAGDDVDATLNQQRKNGDV